LHRIVQFSTAAQASAAGARETGLVVTGQGCRGFKDGSDGLLNGPRALALAADGRLFIADAGNYRIRCLHLSASHAAQTAVPYLETVAGDGARRSRDGALLDSSLAFPYGLCWVNEIIETILLLYYCFTTSLLLLL